MRWMWENDSPGKRASRKRSTRILFSSAVTTTVWTLVGSGGGSAFTFSMVRDAMALFLTMLAALLGKAHGACHPADGRRALGLRAPIGTRALRAIAWGGEVA